jgi:deazaflavin-dependent oxidoreductase (nitroreductase family)
MIPLHQAGLAVWLGNPLTGWQCLLTTIGRRSRLRRHTPLGYIVMDGATWVLAGYGPKTQWYRNILAEPRVELRLPGRRPIAALAEDVDDPATRARVIPALCRSMALPGAMIGCFPPASTDERILEGVPWVPLARISPADGSVLQPGPDDPGGQAWLWRQVVMTGTAAGLVVLLRRLLHS